MSVYVINFALNMIVGMFIHFSKLKTNERIKKFYLILTVVQLSLLAGFRSTSVGWDTSTYKFLFDYAPSSFENIFYSKYIEIGFSVLCSFIKIFGGNFQHLLIITSAFVVSSCCIFIKRHSKNYLLSVFLIWCFPFYYTSFDIIRHSIAIAFFLLGYKYIEEKNFIKFCIFLLLGSLFHKGALLFLPLYFINKVRWNYIAFIIAIIFGGVCLFFIEDFAPLLFSIIGKGSQIESGWIGVYSGGVKTSIMYIVLWLLSIVFYHNIQDKNKDNDKYVWYAYFLLISSILFIKARMMIRVIMLFVPLMAIAFPNLIFGAKKIKNQFNNKLCLVLLIVISLAYHAFMLLTNWQNIVPYVPYWN